MTGRDLRMTAGVERGRAVTIVVDGRPSRPTRARASRRRWSPRGGA